MNWIFSSCNHAFHQCIRHIHKIFNAMASSCHKTHISSWLHFIKSNKTWIECIKYAFFKILGISFAIRRKLISIYLQMWGFTKNNVTWVTIANIFLHYWKVHDLKLSLSWWIKSLHKMIDITNRPQVFLTEGAKKINLYFNYPCSNFVLRGLPIFFWDKMMMCTNGC